MQSRWKKISQAIDEAAKIQDFHADQLACALGTIINVFDPEVVVLGGGLSNLPDIAARVQARLPPFVFGPSCDTRVVVASHGDSSGVRGAAWLWGRDETTGLPRSG